MLYTSDIEVCIRVTFKCVCELRAHRAHLISHTHSIIFRYYSACYYALSAYLCRHTLLVLTSIHIRGSEMFSPAPQSLSLGRWRVSELGDGERQSWEMASVRAGWWRASELGDDERQSWEMTEVTRRRWRVWQSRDDECEEVVDTSKLERRWRKGRRGDDECEAVVDTSKRERRWRKRVLWDDVELCGKFMSETPLGVWVRCLWVYGWGAVGCMGEMPLGVWVRHQHLYGWDTSTAVG